MARSYLITVFLVFLLVGGLIGYMYYSKWMNQWRFNYCVQQEKDWVQGNCKDPNNFGQKKKKRK